MSKKDNHSRRVMFDTVNELRDKIDKLMVMIGKLAARDSRSGRQFKPKIYQGKRRGQNGGSYDRCSYDQWGIKIDIGKTVEVGDNADKIEVDQGMNKFIEEEILEAM